MDQGADSYRRFLAGDEGALGELVKAYRPGLRAYLYGMVHDWETADDLTQETFVKLCLKKPRDKRTASFKTWLFTIGRRTALDHLRRQKIRTVPLDDCFDLSAGDTPETEILRKQATDRLYKALEQLQPQHRQILYLVYFESFAPAEVAKILGKSSHNTSALLYRAKQALRRELQEEVFSDEDR